MACSLEDHYESFRGNHHHLESMDSGDGGSTQDPLKLW